MVKLTYPLRTILWETTLKCNAHCSFCGSRCTSHTNKNELQKEEVINLFKHLSLQTEARNIMVNVTGGEPLVRSDTIDIMKIVHSFGYPWGLVTNGMLLNKKTVYRLKDAGMSTISISLDGIANTHNQIRGVENGFDKVIEGLYNLKDAGFVETIMLTTVVNRYNINELNQLKELLISLPFDIWRICPVDEIGRATDNTEILLSKEELYIVLEFIKQLRCEELPFKVTTSCSHYLGKYEFQTRDLPFSCQAGRTMCSILANGDIFVCPNVKRLPELVQGNVRTHDLFTVWQNEFAFFRDFEKRHIGKCSNCKHFTRCGGDSIHTWDFENKKPNFCAVELKLIDEQQKLGIFSIRYEDIVRELKDKHEKLLRIKVDAQSRASDKIIIKPEATIQLLRFFNWGNVEQSNEQLCALYGNIFLDAENEIETIIVVINEILPVTNVVCSETELEVNEVIVEKAKHETEKRDSTYLLLGFAHSHPNELDIAMSLGDYKFHRELFQKDWKMALSIIVNPQKKHIAAFAGSEADHVELNLFLDKSQLKSLFNGI